MHAPEVDILLLGAPEIRVADTRLEVDTRKAIALLAYLVVEGSATRDSLAALLWADADEERARAALRRTLSSLRGAIGSDNLETDRHRVGLRRHQASDVSRFADAVEATARHDHDPVDVCSRCVPLLEEATRLYRGDFLAGFNVRGAPEFEDWVRVVREALRRRAGEVLSRLSSSRAEAGDYAGAIASVSRWIELDPLHEPAHRRLMLLHAWAGDRPAAVETYRSCVAIFDRELGVPPLEETTELYEAILDEDLPPPPGARRGPVGVKPVIPITQSDLIDRERELAQIERRLVATSTERGGVVVVSGDPWMGKTRLVEEFLARIPELGPPVIKGRGFTAERSLPYGVVVQLLRSTPALEEAPAWALGEVSKLVPDLAGSPPPLPPTHDAYGETRLFDALVQVLAQARPAVIWVDDAQWCDQASVSMIAYLAHRIGQTPCLLMLSMRSSDPSTPLPLQDLLRPGSEVEHIDLGPFDATDLAAHLPTPGEAELVMAHTGGVPLLVAAYLSEGESGLAPGVQRYLETHLADLGGLDHQLLTTAAVLSGTCDLDLIRLTSGRSEAEVVDGVERLLGRNLLRAASEGDAITFALEAVERLVYERASSIRKRLLHGRAAQALKGRVGSEADPRTVAAVARHLQLAAAASEAAEWYLRAAELASRVYAHVEAEQSYQQSLALGHPETGRIRLSLAKIYLLTGRYRVALAEYETVAATAEPADAARAEHGIGEVYRRLGRLDAAAQHFELAEEGHPELGQLHADRALLAHRLGRAEEAIGLARQCLEEAESGGDSALIARAHHLLGLISSNLDQSEASFRRALDLAGDDPGQRMASLNGLAWTMSRASDHSGARPLVEEALRLAQMIGDRHRQAALLNHLADIHHRIGDEAMAQRMVTESVRLFAEIEPDAWEPEIWLLTMW